MMTKSKTRMLLVMGVTTLGIISMVVATNSFGVNIGSHVLASGGLRNTSRTITVNKDNRTINLYGSNHNSWTAVAYTMNDGLAQAAIQASQSQQDVHDHKDNAVVVLWDNSNYNTCYFTINSDYYDSNPLYYDSARQQPLNIVKYNHLTQIDITLDTSDNKRILELEANIGVLNKIGESDAEKYIKYAWTPDNIEGYISTDTDVTFRPEGGPASSNNCIWVRELTFYYDC